ncbi:MAG: exodeoxyribonuclease VII large subunit [Verrucomicrobia bacterium]|jgi:exodeoxyribonuclease VII large subunit|nr:exodeoxyribonuclease VII large subunit [Verrucomicrobiota bacterium]OQC66861.1 MAG: Exodeoxyribonuclease 7 large subunit [Verrucomicrobia bacterium ADurb.Bin006]MDI9380075.1 exodeoxyribonuclease VII large subunit [Verrucomicrobiota bacterium]NMD18720.1 exodeoxyribonuclease VII large subunit [Verrucomicrobiota bacterium]HOA61395.1 exodeoxyribonuclease VII large subunit [Verrucomicrobiota bacterium]
MGKVTESQWDFAELFTAAETRQVLTVTELTSRVKRLIEGQFPQVWVGGEISNLRAQASGHCYFTLKDPGAQLNCVLFRAQARGNREVLEDGAKVNLHGELTVYEPRGQYQLIVTRVELQGLGALQLAFERLKRKLQTEGLFDVARKRPIPRCPQRVGIVTSPTGAALRDVLHVILRRHPSLELILVPCRVQGTSAAEEIAAAIRRLNAFHAECLAGGHPAARGGLDVILVTRGGGSLEDLWAFNEEAVARAIAASTLPVISAVGHEIDFTISDFVADLRAATPSAAAEILTEGGVAGRAFLAEAAARLGQLARQGCKRARDEIEHCRGRLARVHPRRRLQVREQRLDDLRTQLARAARFALRGVQARLLLLFDRTCRVRPRLLVARRRESLALTSQRLHDRARRALGHRQQRIAGLAARIRLLSPENVLARGYSITTDAQTGRVLRSAVEAQAARVLRTRLSLGEVVSVVEGPSG